MLKQNKIARAIFLLALLFILVGCNTIPPAAPTPDLNTVRTEAASTVMAQFKQATAAAPTATQAPTKAPATNTPAPTATPVVITATAAPVASTSTSAPANTATKAAVYVAYPTNTPSRPDAAVLTSQNPADGITVNQGDDFDITWTVRNTGTKSWNTKYFYKYVKGEELTKNGVYYLSKDVNVGETISLTADVVAPRTPGNYITYWALVNDNGEIFYSFSFRVMVK